MAGEHSSPAQGPETTPIHPAHGEPGSIRWEPWQAEGEDEDGHSPPQRRRVTRPSTAGGTGRAEGTAVHEPWAQGWQEGKAKRGVGGDAAGGGLRQMDGDGGQKLPFQIQKTPPASAATGSGPP